ncbi:MAG: RDD family protein [Bacteroidota bacterium]
MESPNPNPFETGTSTELATKGKRILAYFLDALIIGVIGGVTGNQALAGALSFAYILVRDALPFFDGQSLGKKIVGIKAVTEDGASLSGDWGTTIKRNIILAIPVVGVLVELVVLLVSDKSQRLGDQIGGTKVVNA